MTLNKAQPEMYTDTIMTAKGVTNQSVIQSAFYDQRSLRYNIIIIIIIIIKIIIIIISNNNNNNCWFASEHHGGRVGWQGRSKHFSLLGT